MDKNKMSVQLAKARLAALTEDASPLAAAFVELDTGGVFEILDAHTGYRTADEVLSVGFFE